MITPSGAPLSSSAYNPASPPVQGAFATASHPPGARIVPGGPSLSGPPQPREGHKLVPDDREDVGGESTRYEVEFVNREPVFAQSHRHGRPTAAQSPQQQQQGVPGAMGLFENQQRGSIKSCVSVPLLRLRSLSKTDSLCRPLPR